MWKLVWRYSPLMMLALGVLIGTVSAHDYKLGAIEINHPWAKPSIGQAKAGAAFVTLVNSGDSDDRLVEAKADVSELVELHTHTMEEGVMRMRAVEAIEVPAGETAELKPGGFHVMLLNLKAPLVEGESFPLTLVFEQAGEVTVEVMIDGEMAKMKGGGHDHGTTN